MSRKIFIILITISVVVKLAVFALATAYSPEAKIEIDSKRYLQNAEILVNKGMYGYYTAQDAAVPDKFRTPGYPVFLAIFHILLRIPLTGIVFLQIMLTILAAFITYHTALEINPKVAPLAALIVLYDIPSFQYSLMIMTEVLFLLFMACVIYTFVRYLKTKKLKWLASAAALAATAAYVRPIGYYLGSAFVVYFISLWIMTKFFTLKQTCVNSIVTLIICASIIVPWHIRNYRISGEANFSNITKVSLDSSGLVGSYGKDFLEHFWGGMTPPVYYPKIISRCLSSLMTRPGTFKHLKIPWLKTLGKIFGYPFTLFWLIGFFVSISQARNNAYLQFCLLIVLYFIAATIGGTILTPGPRFRIPMLPALAILSSWGWMVIKNKVATSPVTKTPVTEN